MSHESRFSSCDSKCLFYFVAQISPSLTEGERFSALQILTAVFVSLLRAFLQIAVNREAHGKWQSNEAVRLEGVYLGEIQKANNRPYFKPLLSISDIYKLLPSFSSVLWTYFLSSSLQTQFTAKYPIWRLCWTALKTITNLPENLQRPKERLTKFFYYNTTDWVCHVHGMSHC